MSSGRGGKLKEFVESDPLVYSPCNFNKNLKIL